MAGGSSRLYMQRKHLKPAAENRRPQFRTGALPYHDRPHVTLPELAEHDPNVYVPPTPPPE